LQATTEMREELLAYQRDFYKMLKKKGKSKVKGYVFDEKMLQEYMN
jgi:hypothetical protein